MPYQDQLLYSQKIWQFGSLCNNRQIKISQNFLLVYTVLNLILCIDLKNTCFSGKGRQSLIYII